MIYAGIDAGSRAIKIALLDGKTQETIAVINGDQGVKQQATVAELFHQLFDEKNISEKEIKNIVATGYARNLVDFADTTITEITCHARGVNHLVPDARTIIEIGGQDSKLLRLNDDGTVRDFSMNDRCAAGTGRFLEIVANRLDLNLEDLGEMAQKSNDPATISSMCVVFAETEIIGLLSSGRTPEDLVAGIQKSIATRIAAMAGSKLTPPVVFTGGVALISGMDKALTETIGQPVTVVPNPQMTGALGAALLAARQVP